MPRRTFHIWTIVTYCEVSIYTDFIGLVIIQYPFRQVNEDKLNPFRFLYKVRYNKWWISYQKSTNDKITKRFAIHF